MDTLLKKQSFIILNTNTTPKIKHAKNGNTIVLLPITNNYK